MILYLIGKDIFHYSIFSYEFHDEQIMPYVKIILCYE